MYNSLRSVLLQTKSITSLISREPSHLRTDYLPLLSAASLSSSSSGSHSSSKTGQTISNRTYPRAWSKCESEPKYKTMATLETLNFDNVALRALPIDPQDANYVRQVSGACFSRIEPTPVENPHTVAYSVPAMALLDLPESELEREEFSAYMCGNAVLEGAEPAAHCYCGHQFGNFAGQLGDGATMYLGEVVNKKNERWEVQFKGAGKTPYSRTADGRKVLRSSIREFLCSEAMHHLGIPTTRAGSCVTSDTLVIRDIHYTGNPIQEKATIILRIAETFIRFGSFEIFKARDPMTGRGGPSVGRDDILEQLLDYVVQTFYPEIWEKHPDDKKSSYLDFYREIVKRTAKLVSDWQCVGWCHGVLNTDNMSIVGLTIDYGPYGFMDTFDRGYICNGSDDGGRYAYDQQPDMCKWNLGKLAEALAPLISKEETSPILETYDELYENFYMQQMRKKFGLLKVSKPEDRKGFGGSTRRAISTALPPRNALCRRWRAILGSKADIVLRVLPRIPFYISSHDPIDFLNFELVKSFLDTLEKAGADMTNSFRCLSRLPLPGTENRDKDRAEVTEYFLAQCCTVEDLRKINAPKMDPRQIQMFMMLAQMNPDLLQQFGRGAGTLVKEMERIEKTKELKSLTQEKKHDSDLELWTSWLEKYEARLTEDMKDVEDLKAYSRERISVMNSCNPRFVLRNYIAQNAIKAAEDGDFSEVRRVLRLLESPFSDSVEHTELMSHPAKGASTSTQEETAGASASTSVKKSGANASCTGQSYDSKAPTWANELVVT